MTDEIVFDAAVQQLHRAVGIEQARQALFTFRWCDTGGRVMGATALLVQVAEQTAQRGEQSRQAAAGLPLAMALGDQLTDLRGLQRFPSVDPLPAAEGQHLGEIAAIPVERVGRHLALMAQMVEVGIQIGLHG